MNTVKTFINMAVEYFYFSFTYYVGKAYLNFTAYQD